jgi:nucleoside-diphosphate kinase
VPTFLPFETKNQTFTNYWLLAAGLAAGTLAVALLQDDQKAQCASVPIHGVPGTKQERSFIAIKPDGVNRNLIGEVISRFERKGYKLVGIKVVKPTEDHAAKHYTDLKGKPFFPGLVKFFSSGAVVAMVWEGKGVIKGGRYLVGATNPDDSAPGTLRGDLCIEIGRNVIHASDSADSAKAEIGLWFTENEVADYTRTNDAWVYEK